MRRLICPLLAFVLLLCALPCAGAAQARSRTVRVAYPIQDGLTAVDEHGGFSGYTYEYLEEIAQYTGWDYEFVQVEGTLDEQLSTLMDMLQRGEVDLMGGILYTAGMEELFDYASHSYGAGETVLQIPNDAELVVINSQLHQSFRVAVLRQSERLVRELEDFNAMNLNEAQYVMCENDTEQIQAVREGRADMLLNSSMNNIPGLRTVARFASKPFYFVTSKGGRPLADGGAQHRHHEH